METGKGNTLSQSVSEPDIRWAGESGRRYGYWIHPIDVQFRKIAGNVIFARQTETGEWTPLYIGETRDFDEGFAPPEREACARGQGATHVHVHFSSPSWQIRKAEEEDLIARWKPPCNEIGP